MQTIATQTVLDTIARVNDAFVPARVKKVMLIYEERDYYIGDTCIRVGFIELLVRLFKNADIHMFWRNEQYTSLYISLLMNNPYFAEYKLAAWPELDFHGYDVAFVMSFKEQELLEIIAAKYDLVAPNSIWNTAVFSLSRQVLDYNLRGLIPVFREYIDFSTSFANYVFTYKLFITPAEKEWAARWLKDHGMKDNERLFIVLDSSAGKTKLLRIDVYFDILKYLLGIEGVRVLIFDEKGKGKSLFYSEWLGEEAMSKIIFSERLGLRQNLCLIASDHTRLVLGPCTGLIHCASAIYNNFVEQGMPIPSVPLMITYTGKYDQPEHNALKWWGASPLVTCLILRQCENRKEVILLSSLDEKEGADTSKTLPCREYTPAMIIPYLKGLQIQDISFESVTI